MINNHHHHLMLLKTGINRVLLGLVGKLLQLLVCLELLLLRLIQHPLRPRSPSDASELCPTCEGSCTSAPDWSLTRPTCGHWNICWYLLIILNVLKMGSSKMLKRKQENLAKINTSPLNKHRSCWMDITSPFWDSRFDGMRDPGVGGSWHIISTYINHQPWFMAYLPKWLMVNSATEKNQLRIHSVLSIHILLKINLDPINILYIYYIYIYWLVVSTPLKNISQLRLLFPIYGKIKKCSKQQYIYINNIVLNYFNYFHGTSNPSLASLL